MAQSEQASESTSLPSSTEESALQTLRDEVRALRSLVSVAAMALLLLSFGLNAYLYYQDRIIRKDLQAAKRMAQEFDNVRRPMISAFVNRLQDFGRSHPDINPLLDKYGIRPGPTPSPAPGPVPEKSGK